MNKSMFQNLIIQVKEIINSEIGIIDDSGMIIACSEEKKTGQSIPFYDEIFESKERTFVYEACTFQKVVIRNRLEFTVFIKSDKEEAVKYLSLISINLVNMKLYYDEKFDKNNFFKNIFKGHVLPGEISVKAKDLHISANVPRSVFFIKTEKTGELFLHEVIQELFPNKSKDFIIFLDDDSTVLVKELKTIEDHKEIEKTAKIIIDTLNTESMVKALIGIGNPSDNINELGRSFQEAQTALLVGSVFESDKSIFYYNNLGLGRLIYQLPEGLCRLFLKEVFQNESFEALDSEYIVTVQKFFENNLNVSETSRQMFLHRNTLVYRLDKIQKMTGLDLTKFDDAIILKFAMLIKRYLDKGGKV